MGFPAEGGGPYPNPLIGPPPPPYLGGASLNLLRGPKGGRGWGNFVASAPKENHFFFTFFMVPIFNLRGWGRGRFCEGKPFLFYP